MPSAWKTTPKGDLVIEYPLVNATSTRDEYAVYAYGTYPPGTVLAGQTMRSFVESFDTLAEAQENYPAASWNGGGTGYAPVSLPSTPPAWFDSAAAGESWDGETMTYRGES
jgi:hypothetical protein